ncbi:hypothetical protein ACJJIK_10065 [Microbulbifer sp. ZKSA006]|uniref:hypothetical protein n=1 Tax=Microbulbifer sp. ZKSA006 TaxID=3243390 RepID=UPI00403949FF
MSISNSSYSFFLVANYCFSGIFPACHTSCSECIGGNLPLREQAFKCVKKFLLISRGIALHRQLIFAVSLELAQVKVGWFRLEDKKR